METHVRQFSVAVGLHLLLTASSVAAQTLSPNVIEFLPPPEHSLLLSSGQPVVTRYGLLVYPAGSLDAVAQFNLGKPSRQSDGLVRIDLTSHISTWPSSANRLEVRIAAFGPNGVAVSDPSNAFLVPPVSSGDTPTYLSDIEWTVLANGWGPPEQDRSNGERGEADGRTLTLNGVRYAKGLGVHSHSDIRYRLNGACSLFQASIGVDDEVGSRGSVVFEVWADGARILNSGLMTGTTATRGITLDITNRQELTLRVTDGGDGSNSDHADWADARITCRGSATHLSDISWTSMKNGWGPAERDRSNGEQAAGDGRTLSLNGRTYTKGLGVHAPSEIRYALDGACSLLQADVGVDDETGTAGSVVFQVWTDGTKVFDSGRMTGATATRAVAVDITGRRQLTLRVTDAGDGRTSDHADWANARVSCGSSELFYVSDASWTSMINGWGPAERDRSNGEQAAADGRPLTLDGRTYSKGLGVHSYSAIGYALNGACTAFHADIGIDDEAGSDGSVVFEVWTDGTRRFASGVMTGATPSRSISVSIHGARDLLLVVTDAGDGATSDHADWADARVSCAAGS